MTDETDTWTKDCEPLDFINMDICFCINEDFYYGPSDVFSIAERKQTTPLPSVTNKSAATHDLRSLKAEDNAEKLLAYYKEVLRLAKNYGKKPTDITDYFWLRLSFWRTEMDISINFPWYDSLDEIAPVLERMASGADGIILADMDQGWDIEIVAKDGFIYAREGDFEENELNILHKIPRAPLAAECENALSRTRNLIAWLSDEIGDDYWTKTKYPEDLFAKE